MTEARYDNAAAFYSDFVKKSLASPNSVLSVTTQKLEEVLAQVKGLITCDIACGEGHLSRRLAEQGAVLTSVDISQGLLKRAKEQTDPALSITFVHDDAQTLVSLPNDYFDLAVINLALMDIPNHKKVFTSCQRILKQGGTFVFSVLHPCFESPFHVTKPQIELDNTGEFIACRVHSYLKEGHWDSGGDGVRGHVGAYHRTLSSYLNDLLAAGFQLEHTVEVALPEGHYERMEDQWFSKVPRSLIIKAKKV